MNAPKLNTKPILSRIRSIELSRSLSDDDYDDDSILESDSDDEIYMHNISQCTIRDAMRETMFACVTCVDVDYEIDFEQSLRMSYVFDGSLVDKTIFSTGSLVDSKRNDSSSSVKSIISNENPKDGIDAIGKEKVSNLSSWNELEEEHEVNREEFLSDKALTSMSETYKLPLVRREQLKSDDKTLGSVKKNQNVIFKLTRKILRE